MPRDPNDFNDALVGWLHSHYGPGRKYRSGRQWSIRAGLNSGAVNAIETAGYGSPTALIALARAAGVPPLYVLQMDGHLTPEECDPSQLELTPQEQELLQRYRNADAGVRMLAESLLSRLYATSPDPGSESPNPT